jgi:hypothetical protein
MSRKAKAAGLLQASAAPVPSLSALCAEAATHVAKARTALFIDAVDADRALAELDEAIACLQRLLAYGRKDMNGANGKARLHA